MTLADVPAAGAGSWVYECIQPDKHIATGFMRLGYERQLADVPAE